MVFKWAQDETVGPDDEVWKPKASALQAESVSSSDTAAWALRTAAYLPELAAPQRQQGSKNVE